MKAAFLLKTFVLCSFMATATTSQAQLSEDELPGKIQVQLKITPSLPGFYAGINTVDSSCNKIKLWVSNKEETKFSVTIRNQDNILWTSDLAEAYYSQVFDLSGVEDGEYLFSIRSGGQQLEKRVIITSYNYVQRELSIR